MTENPKHLLEISTESSPDRPSKITKIEGVGVEQQEQQQQQDTSFESQSMTQKHGLQRYLVAIEYIGTRFSGSQQQSNCRTVVGTLEEAFHKFIGQPVPIFCSSRTDAGVHALSNVCHVDVERISKRKPGEVLPPHEPAVIKNAVNHFLQKNCDDVMVTNVRAVPSDFHARYKAQERTYFYRLLSGPESLSTFERNRAWHVPEELDLLAMQAACKVLIGHHDFSSFRGSGCQANSPIRTLEELNVSEVAPTPYFPSPTERGQNKCSDTNQPLNSTRTDDQVSGFIDGCVSDVGFGIRKRHRCFVVTARARSFLYHQVRLMVGVLKAVGTGHLTISDVERILNAKTVTATSAMAPASGLYLGHVKYDLP